MFFPVAKPGLHQEQVLYIHHSSEKDSGLQNPRLVRVSKRVVCATNGPYIT